MKAKITKLVLLLLAVLTTGSVKAATETYDFKALSQGLSDEYTLPTIGDNVANDMQMISLGENTFNNRFSTGPRAQNTGGTNCFRFRKTSNWEGLHNSGAYSGRYFSIRNLKAGDKITITLRSTNENIKFRDTGEDATKATVKGVTLGTDAVTSNQEYEIESDGIVNLETTGACIIEKIVIETPSTSVPVTINVIPDATTEEYDFQALGQTQASDGTFDVTFGTEVLASPASIMLISFGEEHFNNRFAGNRDWAIRKHANATYCALYNKNGYSSRYLAICDLKAGDKVTIKFFCDTDQSLIFQNAIVNGVTAGNAVVSDQEYTVNTNGTLILDEGANTQNKRVYIYKVTIEPASSSTGTYIGATLVSGKALDFTSVDDITAYVATSASAGSVTFSKVTKVAANTPLYIKANAASGAVINVDIPEATEGAVDYSATNKLKGSASATAALQSTADTKYYVFGVQSGVAGFYPVSTTTSFTSAAGKAYLELTAAEAAASAHLNMIFDEGSETTGINDVRSQKEEVRGEYYDLSGRRVAQPTRGLYIVNGKKVIIK